MPIMIPLLTIKIHMNSVCIDVYHQQFFWGTFYVFYASGMFDSMFCVPGWALINASFVVTHLLDIFSTCGGWWVGGRGGGMGGWKDAGVSSEFVELPVCRDDIRNRMSVSVQWNLIITMETLSMAISMAMESVCYIRKWSAKIFR